MLGDYNLFSGEISNEWDIPAKGSWRNFNFQTNLPDSNIETHTINPALNQLFIDQYLFWNNFRHKESGFYCDGQPTTAESVCITTDRN